MKERKVELFVSEHIWRVICKKKKKRKEIVCLPKEAYFNLICRL